MEILWEFHITLDSFAKVPCGYSAASALLWTVNQNINFQLGNSDMQTVNCAKNQKTFWSVPAMLRGLEKRYDQNWWNL